MNVKKLRGLAGLSQQELADKTGIPKPRIAKWEQGEGTPKAEDTEILKKFFKEFIPHETDVKGEIAAHGALLSILVNELAAIKSSMSGENAAVIVKKIYKAAEELAALEKGG